MAQMIGAKLRLEAVGCDALGRGHHTSIGDHQVELLPGRDQPIGTGADARQGTKIQLDQLQPTAAGGVAQHHLSGAACFTQIARGADHRCAMRRERARRLYAKPRRHARHQDALAGQIDVFEHVVCC